MVSLFLLFCQSNNKLEYEQIFVAFLLPKQQQTELYGSSPFLCVNSFGYLFVSGDNGCVVMVEPHLFHDPVDMGPPTLWTPFFRQKYTALWASFCRQEFTRGSAPYKQAFAA